MKKTSFPIRKIIKRDGSIAKYDRNRIEKAILKATTSVGKPNSKLARSITAEVEAALLHTYGAKSMPSVEDIQDVVENNLMQNRKTRIARNYIIYRHRRAMERAARLQSFEARDFIPYKLIYETLLWNMDHGCDSVQALNKLIEKKQFPDLVRATDRRYSEEVGSAASMILEGSKKTRIVIVSGPSSSGKTTTTIKVGEKLKKAGMRLRMINIDHYFFDLEMHPKDQFGDYDYEIPEALDLKLINQHLVQLLAGKTVRTPHYDFKTGKRRMDVHELKLAKNEILLIDSLHGLYKKMTQSVPDECKFRLYIETLGQMRSEDGTFVRWSDNRLLRRMIRDKDHRNLQPMQTLSHWHYVRSSELKNIIPYIGSADCVVNSALPYELPVLKPRLFRFFPGAIKKYTNDPHRLDAHIRAKRVYELLKSIKTVRDNSPIPSDSLLREFIGGSRYRY